MTAAPSDQTPWIGRPVLLTAPPEQTDAIVVNGDSWWLRLLSWIHSFSLDSQLASGSPPESNRLLARRAQHLVSLPARRALASDWQRVGERARCRPGMHRPQAPLCRSRIVRAGRQIQELSTALSVPLPAPVRGVAMASLLLRDGAGPLYNVRSTADLQTLLRACVVEMDPANALDDVLATQE